MKHPGNFLLIIIINFILFIGYIGEKYFSSVEWRKDAHLSNTQLGTSGRANQMKPSESKLPQARPFAIYHSHIVLYIYLTDCYVK